MPENRTLAFEAGGLEAITFALRTHVYDARVASQACLAIFIICLHEENRDTAAAAAAVSAIAAALRAHVGDAVGGACAGEDACYALRYLCFSDHGEPIAENVRRARIGGAGRGAARLAAARARKEDTVWLEELSVTLNSH